MKKYLVFFGSLFLGNICHAATAGNLTVMGKVVSSYAEISTMSQSAAIGFIDGSTQTTAGYIRAKEEGTLIMHTSTINCVGTNITCADAGNGVLSITITGGSGGGGGGSLVYYDGTQFISLSTVSMIGIKSASLNSGTSFFFFESTGNWTAAQRFFSSSTFNGGVTHSSFTSLSTTTIIDNSSLAVGTTSGNGAYSVTFGPGLGTGINVVGTGANGIVFYVNAAAQMTVNNGNVSLAGFYTGSQGGTAAQPMYSFQTDNGMHFPGALDDRRLTLTAEGRNGFMLFPDGRLSLGGSQTPISGVSVTSATASGCLFSVSSGGLISFLVCQDSASINTNLFISSPVIVSSISASIGMLANQATFYQLTASTVSFPNVSVSIATTLVVGQHLIVAQVNGNNAIIASGGDNAGSGSGSDSGDAFGNPISTRPLTSPRGIEVSSGTVFSTWSVYGLIQSTSGALLGGTTVQGVFLLEGGTFQFRNGTNEFSIVFATGGYSAGDRLIVSQVTGNRFVIASGKAVIDTAGSGTDTGDPFGNPISTRPITSPRGVEVSSGIVFSTWNVFGLIQSTAGALLGNTTIQGVLTVEGGSITINNNGIVPFTLNFASAPSAGQKLGVTGAVGNRLTIGGVGDNAGSGSGGGPDPSLQSPATGPYNLNRFGISQSTGIELGDFLQLTTFLSTSDAQQTKFVNFLSTYGVKDVDLSIATRTIGELNTLTFNEEGSAIGGHVSAVNCVGSVLTCSQSGSTTTITATGASSQVPVIITTSGAIYHMNYPMSALLAMSTTFGVSESTAMYKEPGSLVNFMPVAFDPSTTEYMYGSFIVPTNIDLSSNATITFSLMPKTSSASMFNVQMLFESSAVISGSIYNYQNSTGVDVCPTSVSTSGVNTCSFSQSISALDFNPNETVFFRIGRGHDTSKLLASELRSDLYVMNMMLDLPLVQTAISQGDNLGNGKASIVVDLGGQFALTGASQVVTGITASTNSFVLVASTATNMFHFGVSTRGYTTSMGAQPTLSSCGSGPSFSVGSNNIAGTVTAGATSGGCTVTFGVPYTNDPTCTVQPQTISLVNSFSYTHSNIGIVVTQTALGTGKFDYMCIGKE